MAATSGKNGKIVVGSSTLVECTGWDMERRVAIHEYASCMTSGHKAVIAGTKSATMNLRGVRDPADPIENYVEEGDSVTLKLYYTATKYHSVPAVIESVKDNVDIEEGEFVRWEITARSSGLWTLNQA